jgi:FixJ family two-component response regulator
MRTGRPVSPITLSPEERRALTRLSKRPSGVSEVVARRAQIILAAAGQRGQAPLTGKQIARLLRVSEQTVSLWRMRFVRSRLAALTSTLIQGAHGVSAKAG